MSVLGRCVLRENGKQLLLGKVDMYVSTMSYRQVERQGIYTYVRGLQQKSIALTFNNQEVKKEALSVPDSAKALKDVCIIYYT